MPLAAPPVHHPRQVVRVVCRRCYNVLFVGTKIEGKLFCKPCQTFTPARVAV